MSVPLKPFEERRLVRRGGTLSHTNAAPPTAPGPDFGA